MNGKVGPRKTKAMLEAELAAAHDNIRRLSFRLEKWLAFAFSLGTAIGFIIGAAAVFSCAI